MDFESYLETLASAAPTPGGGSAASLVAASAAALVAMVARITIENPKFAASHAAAGEIVARADELRVRALAGRAADEAAYGCVIAAMALPKASPEEKAARTAALQSALAGAAAEPLAAAEIARAIAALCEASLVFGNINLIADLGSAVEFAAAAFASAAFNVRTNHTFMKDRATIEAQAATLARYESEIAPLVARVRAEAGRAFVRS